MKLGIIVGSTRVGNVGQSIGKLVFNQSKVRKANYELINIADYSLSLLGEKDAKEAIQKWNDKINSLDGYVFIAAEYNHSVTGSLKNALDLAGIPTWINKPAGIVSYGFAGGARAAEHLRTILGALGVADVQQHVLFNLNSEMSQTEDFKPANYQVGLLNKLFDQVELWGNALKSTRG
ncbi:MAG: NAD(P)H-dependent oxidoreductase [Firmicutes bacterium]|nr:NAD(P)H-dependent oxidoreductase [Bacillota bacterium]